MQCFHFLHVLPSVYRLSSVVLHWTSLSKISVTMSSLKKTFWSSGLHILSFRDNRKPFKKLVFPKDQSAKLPKSNFKHHTVLFSRKRLCLFWSSSFSGDTVSIFHSFRLKPWNFLRRSFELCNIWLARRPTASALFSLSGTTEVIGKRIELTNVYYYT